jgi:hypothetical protein
MDQGPGPVTPNPPQTRGRHGMQNNRKGIIVPKRQEVAKPIIAEKTAIDGS